MKVHIGPYRHWYSAYQCIEKPYMKWKYKDAYYDIDEEDHTFIDRVVVWCADNIIQHVFDWTVNLPYRFFNRRHNVRIDPYDTWCMDHTLAPIILPMLKQLKENQHGAPNIKDEDVPEELRAVNAIGPVPQWSGVDASYWARWQWALDEMIWAFEQIEDEESDAQFHNKGFDQVAYKAWDDRITRGTTLFGKYYRNLWD